MDGLEAKNVIVSLIYLLLDLKVLKRQPDVNSIDRYTMRRIGLSVEHKDEQL